MERRRPRQPPIRPLVLVADGHADTCELYATSLAFLGFEITTVSDGADAFAQAWYVRPDVIVTDPSLPGLNEWEFVHLVKCDPRTREIPIVIVTGDGLPRTRERAIREGCAAFRLKPCLPEDLAVTVREVVNGGRGHEQQSSAN